MAGAWPQSRGRLRHIHRRIQEINQGGCPQQSRECMVCCDI